jgi:hypothetical protein|tara:strand:+ start:1300 stop:1617 length:318 start_codon:yes stop_codon:yes gene_type:complete
MKKLLIIGLLSLSDQVCGQSQILKNNIVTLEQTEELSTLVLSSCELLASNEMDRIVKSKVPGGNLIKLSVAGVTYSVESFGLFARKDGKCLLKMKNDVTGDALTD